ncbi:hypothetical protein GCM10009584_11820 [Ornithinimicrobium humiphilum]|uniref:Core-2/I-Branching enzyme n=1 Tax=Ornithinimicrobium humiphilum TaxID=125288 RepID=A0A543KJM5_9MICO|nr:hypothetical protein [Ornithinimicrobium humiphilum]TQM95285.1 hypothetical protein FB476_0124 [Ornithinimicrobium humiphilum]
MTERPVVAYVVLSHGRGNGVLRLATAIRRSSPEARVVIHHDARQGSAPEALGNWMAVHEHRRATDWGSWPLAVEGLRALEEASEATGADVLALVSGQDYPARRLREWEDEFAAQGGGWQCAVERLSYRPRWGRSSGVGQDDWTRYNYLWWRVPGGQSLSRSTRSAACRVRNVAFRAAHRVEPVLDLRDLARGDGLRVGIRNPVSLVPGRANEIKASQWLALDGDALALLGRAHRSRRMLRWIFSRSVIPDEAYLQTLLRQEGVPLVAQPVSFMEWDAERDRPRVLTAADVPRIRASGAPFCRKVDAADAGSAALMDILDELTAEEPRQPGARP